MMQKRVLERIFLLMLTTVLLVQTFDFVAVTAMAEKSDSDTVTIAVNPDLSTSPTNGSVTFSSTGSQNNVLQTPQQDELVGISGIRVNPETGEEIYIREPNLPIEEVGSSKNIVPSKSLSKLNEDERWATEDKKVYRKVKLLYTGAHCTVWGATDDPVDIRMDEKSAEMIADAFDSKFDTVISSFGNWYDLDKDKKLAIFCYDIKSEYPETTTFPYGYTAGFFWAQDLAGDNGYAGNTYTGTTGVKTDCIHLDTYPGMAAKYNGSWHPFEDIGYSYSTLVHEFQHMINFSYRVETGYGEMEDYLNEGFSMAAEHLICGDGSTYNRISYFNDPTDYVPGTSLCVWDGSLSNYSNAYLFGQYIRTRYAQQTNTDGSTIYKEILLQRQAKGGGDTLQMIATKLGTTKLELVQDFWIAVYQKASTGKYGFNGDFWANSIAPQTSNSTGTVSGIYNGGAKFIKGTETADSSSKVYLATIKDGQVNKISLSKTELSLDAGKTETLTATASTGTPTITWTSSNSAVAEVSRDGVVTAKSKGTAVITAAADNGSSMFCTVTVTGKSVIKIEIDTKPTKLSYLEGKDTLDVTGGKIKVSYDNKTSEVINMTTDMISGFDNTKVGPQTLTVTYGGKSCTFDVTIEKDSGGGGGGTGGGCYVATAVYGSYDCPQVWTLRRFRDETLAKTWYGRLFIRTYYAISPTLVKWFGDTDWFKNMWRGPLDKMVANLNAEGVSDTPYDDIDW